jgi:DNA mismatch repair ATPase MutS
MALLSFTTRGGFYEIYDQSARLTSKILGLTVTSRDGRLVTRFPHHCWSENSELLAANGYSVHLRAEGT